MSRDTERTEYLLKRNNEANGVELTMLDLANNEVTMLDLANNEVTMLDIANNEVELSDLDDSQAF